ncbi:MAG: 50S ribosomal protein L11 methyltransferase [Desulfurococcales archaeon]|nr:50S ribosomal protein L11 methyltransferase [Desulfurococcales archaeon]
MGSRSLQLEIGGIPVSLSVGDCTYPPLEDSLLAVRLLEKLKDENRTYDRVLDLCTGSGILGLAASILFGPKLLAATDVSPYALSDSRLNLPRTALVVGCDCADCLLGEWDLVVVNPPYLPEEEYMVRDGCGGYSERSWSGGRRLLEKCCVESTSLGREIVFVYSSLSPFNIEECLKNRGFRIDRRLSEKFFMEEVIAVHAVRS